MKTLLVTLFNKKTVTSNMWIYKTILEKLLIIQNKDFQILK